MIRQRFYIAILLVLVGLGGIAYGTVLWVMRILPPPFSPPAMEADMESESPIAVAQPTRKRIKLFFGDENGEWTLEERVIISTASVAGQAKQAIVELIAGPRDENNFSVLPREVRLKDLFIASDGTAYIDFSKHFAQIEGSEEEIRAVFSVVRTLSANFSEIRKVRFLMEGAEAETLNGHICLEFPIRGADAQVAVSQGTAQTL